jgi:hypothetical protein
MVNCRRSGLDPPGSIVAALIVFNFPTGTKTDARLRALVRAGAGH